MDILPTHDLPTKTRESTPTNLKQNETDRLKYVKQNEYVHNHLNSEQQKEFNHHFSVKQNKYNQSYVKYNKNHRLVETLASTKIVDNSEVSLTSGWWIVKEENWKNYTDCSNGSCKIAFGVQCSSYLHALYQYIPIRQKAPIRGIYFSVSSFNKLLVKQPNPFGHQYGAMALFKFSDGSNYTIQLKFSPLEGHQQKNDVYMLPKERAPLSSISLSLACAGFKGRVSFMDVNVSPIVDDVTIKSHPTLYDFIAKCPDQAPFPNIAKFRFTWLTLNRHIIINADDITLVTQVSADRLYMLHDILPYWDGPVSIAIYIPASESPSDKPIYDDEYIIHKLKNLTQSCEITIMYGEYYKEKYPINTLRNHAIRHVQSKYLFLSDADFLPSVNFQRQAKSEINRLKSVVDHDDDTSIKDIDKTAFVAPAFEYLKNPFKSNNLAKTKAELGQVYKTKSYIKVFNGAWSDNHKATDYGKWFKRSHSYKVTKYQIKYEPYVVLRKHSRLPLYDERFVGYGMNKVSYLMELKAAGYTFLVLPNCWVSHIPHEKTNNNQEFSYDAVARLKNRVLRYEFMADYTRKYEIGGCSEHENGKD
ncbi:unnamed protein product [Owenia fusiformis]|uniref:Uncharacterized protein n=1 Tax=Owenia fusiformis TaxID=6347 RepID=A0A8J1Y572_OWEFU|nr:unnamed protein product [Owenia fusiformis]